jgi:hypothetical protein
MASAKATLSIFSENIISVISLNLSVASFQFGVTFSIVIALVVKCETKISQKTIQSTNLQK